MRNDYFLDEIIRGNYGRKIAYTKVDKITSENIVKVIGNCIGIFNTNKTEIKYLWNYMKGDQPILYRTKTVRSDVVNKVVENHAWEIVNFKVGQTYGEPIQAVALKDDAKINEYVDKLNAYMKAINKSAKDIEVGMWQSAVGTGYKAIQFTNDKELPFRIVPQTPMNTFVIYSLYTKEPMLAVQELMDAQNKTYYLCYTDTHQYIIQNSTLIPQTTPNGGVVEKLHGFGSIPIVEYPNNPQRISDIELVITMLDAINNMQSNRMDSIEQFVQSWVKFINCEIDEESFAKMQQMGAISVNSVQGADGKSDVDIMSQELKQSESQVAKNDIWDNALSILAIPNKQGNTGGDTQGAVELRNGWDFSKQRAKLKDPFVLESERKINKLCLNAIRIKGNDDCRLSVFDYDVQINHSPTDNMQVKVQSLQMLLQAGIHPLIAVKVVGLFEDAEKVFNLSKPYFDVLYKTIDMIEDEKEQEKKAQELLSKINSKEDEINGNE